MDSNDSNSVTESGVVEVAVQLSRFHTETIEGSATGDVDIRGLSITVGDRELITDAHLALRRGVRYGLVGRNGTGKTTLLKACANKSIPGLTRDMKVMYVQQENVPGDQRSTLQTVLDAASARSALQAQIAELEAALDGDGDDEGDVQAEGATDTDAAAVDVAKAERLVRCVRSILAGRAESQAVEAEQTAARRSRLRGKEALKNAVAAREAARKAQAEELTKEKAASVAPQLLADLYDSLYQLGRSEEEEQRAATLVLDGLGFGAQQLQGMATLELSGGWRMRVALACALLARPHLLLLDEPTNHLDIASILWLQDYLVNRCSGQTLVLVSHDRAFLNAVAQETIVLRDGSLQYFPGTYNAYLQARAEASLHKERQVAGQERQKAHLMDTISRAEKAAREAGDDKRLLQAASRRKKIDRLGAETTADGKRFKVSYWVGYHETLRPQVELDRPEEPVVIQFPPPEQLRQRGPLLQLRDVTVGYGKVDLCSTGSSVKPVALAAATKSQAASKRGVGKSSPAKDVDVARRSDANSTTSTGGGGGGVDGGGAVVLRHVTMDVEQGARIGLLGLNGSGKSSLMRVLSGALAPAEGELASPCPRLVVACLDQHSGRRLLQQAQQDRGSSSMEASSSTSLPTGFSVVQAHASHLKPQEVYDYLGKFAVPGPVANTPLAALSGGQRCRVALALEMLPRPHVLLLDEPTNHLDLLTVQALTEAIRLWEGAAVIASHDLQFLRDTCREVWVVEGGQATRQPQQEVDEAITSYTTRLLDNLRRRADKLLRQQ
ncbi:hypothetical protein VaNZ11_008183 [Volvox africanus]|uniref:ABC transporter domain-containing protein n=1 Tax=Volvox africanus TaxID=51714 RepID=A0ABQ5S564_9CHLO|nr:hypothetical protein VaNZ11_008183 [Volvox africanus]